MTPRLRLILAGLGMLVLLPGIVAVVVHMPTFGDHPLPYGDAINHAAVSERHVTNMVTAVNFDYRGLDTLGEEYMLVGAVTGVIVLLRGRRGESVSDAPGRIPRRKIPPRSDALILVCRFFAPILLLFGIYVALHAQLTPGGGFQGGAIAGSGALLIYLGEGYRAWRRLIRSHLFDAVEAIGALSFVLAGAAGMLMGTSFLTNVLPLGETRALLSGGLILVVNAGVFLAVAGGFVLLLIEFLEETRAAEPEDQQ
jgi:multicomponent Na+:H+ antiporter subunit B